MIVAAVTVGGLLERILSELFARTRAAFEYARALAYAAAPPQASIDQYHTPQRDETFAAFGRNVANFRDEREPSCSLDQRPLAKRSSTDSLSTELFMILY